MHVLPEHSAPDFIHVADDALPGALCDELIATLDRHPGAHAGITTGGVAGAKKSSIDLTIDYHPELADLRERVLATCRGHLTDYFSRYPFVGSLTPVVRFRPEGPDTELTMDNIGTVNRATLAMLVERLFRCGTINIQKYPAGQGGYPHWHCEVTPEPTGEALHRVVLWMYYLNDVAEGGETEFFFQRRAVQPRRGRLVVAPAGFTHTHRGNVPRSGDKYIITSWLLYNRATG